MTALLAPAGAANTLAVQVGLMGRSHEDGFRPRSPSVQAVKVNGGRSHGDGFGWRMANGR